MTHGSGFGKNERQSLDKVIPIVIVSENLPPFNPACHEMMQDTGRINSYFAWQD
jgi:hypothetical protein